LPVVRPDAAPLASVSTWAERYRPVGEAHFDRMDDYLAPSRRAPPGGRWRSPSSPPTWGPPERAPA